LDVRPLLHDQSVEGLADRLDKAAGMMAWMFFTYLAQQRERLSTEFTAN
jgi:hypothetical protein